MYESCIIRSDHKCSQRCLTAQRLCAAGKGFLAMKLNPDDEVLAFGLSKSVYEGPEVVTNQGRAETARFSKFKGRRGAKGALVMRRGFFAEWRQDPQFLLGQSEEE